MEKREEKPKDKRDEKEWGAGKTRITGDTLRLGKILQNAFQPQNRRRIINSILFQSIYTILFFIFILYFYSLYQTMKLDIQFLNIILPGDFKGVVLINDSWLLCLLIRL